MQQKGEKSPLSEKFKELLNSDMSKVLKVFKKHNKSNPKKEKRIGYDKKVISIDIGNNNIKVIVGRQQKDKLLIEKAYMVPTPEGAITDGNLIKTMDIAKVIDKENDGNGIKIKDAVCSSVSTTIINRDILVPIAEGEELSNLVRFEIQQYLPINLDDYIVQYNILGKLEKDGVDKYKVLVVTYPYKLAKQYLNLLTSIGLNPRSLDVTFNSLKKLFDYCEYINELACNPEDTIAVIDMGAENLSINIYNNGQMEFTRLVKSGGNLVSSEIATALNVPWEEAEAKKVQYASLVEIDYSEEDNLNRVLKTVVDDWISELNRIIQFYRNKKVGNKIDKVYLCGGTSRIKGLDDYLSSALNIKVEKIQNMDKIQFTKLLSEADLDIYLNAIGSIIRL